MCMGSRGLTRGRGILWAAALVTAAGLATGQGTEQAPGSLSSERLNAEIARVRQEIQQATDSAEAPAEWKELLAVTQQLNELNVAQAKAQQPLQERLNRLNGTAEVQRWREPMAALSRRLNQLMTEQYRRTRFEGKELYEARHQELAKFAFKDTPALHRLGFDVLTYPRMDGSTSTQPLAALIASRCFNAPYAWGPSGPSYGTFVRSAWALHPYGYDHGPAAAVSSHVWRPDAEYHLVQYSLRARIDLAPHERLGAIVNGLLATNASTHQAYVNLIEGRSDIGLIARGPSPRELELARGKGVELETAPCALDALVFLVHRENPLPGLTLAQIREIYTGKLTAWKAVGGAGDRITPYQREEDSGSQELMRELVMKELAFVKPEGRREGLQLIQYGMGGPYVALTQDKQGLAYSVYYYERFMAGSPHTRTIAIDGVEPSFETIRRRAYPCTSEVLVVTRKGLAPDAPAAKLRAWLLSPEGQAVVRESGYVPVVVP